MSAIAHKVRRPMQLLQRGRDLLENRWQQEEIHQLGIELGAPALQNDLGRSRGVASGAIPAGMRDGIVGIGNGDDPGLNGNLVPTKATRVSATVPVLVMTQNAFAKIRVEAGKGLEHFRATLRVSGDEPPFTLRQSGVIVDNVVDSRMNLADVVEQRDALDTTALVFIEVGGVRQNERVRRHPPYVGAGFVVVGVDRIKEGFEGGSGKAFGRAPRGRLARGEEASNGPHGKTRYGAQHSIFFRHGAQTGQEVGDMRLE